MHAHLFDEMSIFNILQKLNYIFDFIFILFFERMLLKKYNYCAGHPENGDSWFLIKKTGLLKLKSNQNKQTQKMDKRKTSNLTIQSIGLTFRLAISSKTLISSKLNWNYYSYFRGVMVAFVHFKDIKSFACKNKLLSCNHDCIFLLRMCLFHSHHGAWHQQRSFNIGPLEKLITNWSFIQFWTAEEEVKEKKNRRHRFSKKNVRTMWGLTSFIIWTTKKKLLNLWDTHSHTRERDSKLS